MDCIGCSPKDKENIDKWSGNIKEMFVSEGRELFKEFLLSRGLDDAFCTVIFWEKCDSLQIELRKFKYGNSAASSNISNTISEVIEFADEHINFYESQMNALRKMQEVSNEREISTILEKAKQSALDLLSDDHVLFSTHLTNQYQKSLCK